MANTVRIALIQDEAKSEPQAVLADTILSLREAAAKGAQICCLKEMFATPYFCSVQDEAHFDFPTNQLS